jgi:thiol-disulfide isomerase/thioredoxin
MNSFPEICIIFLNIKHAMMKHPVFIVFSLMLWLGFASGLAAQPVTISGTAPGAEDLQVKIIGWKDLITFTETTLATTTIDSTSRFSVQFEISHTSVYAIAIGLHRNQLYLEPGKSYELKIQEQNYKDNLEVNPFIPSENLEITLVNPGENELNIWINAYDDKVNTFLLDHFNALYLERKKNYIDSFQTQINAWYYHVEDPYFQEYIRYKTANLEQVARSMKPASLAKTYFMDQPILYHNVAYMKFFNNFFTKYLTVASDVLRKINLTPIIQGKDAYHKLMETAARDSILRNETFRELVLLNGLFELFYKNPDLEEPIIRVFEEIRKKSPSEENRLIAEDMLQKTTKLRKGTPAPMYSLQGREAEGEVNMADFIGKPIILNFWTTFCEGCLAEMELQVPLYEKYKNDVEFVSICTDKYWIKMNYFAMVKPEFSWPLLHFSDKTELLIDYDVKTYPLYVVIDRDGKIYQYPAPHPSEGLETVIEEVIRY